MKLRTLLRTLPIMLIAAALSIGVVAAPVGAAGTITQTITPTTGSPAVTQVSIAGTGFAPGVYSILFNATVVSTGTIPAGGALSASFIVPTLPKGAYAVTIDDSSADPAVAAGTFTVTQTIITSVATAPVGTTITVNGYGFNPNVAISVYFGGLTTPVAQVAASQNTNGSFITTFLVPQTARGIYNITARDAFTTPASAIASFTVTPRITISAEAGGVGDTVTINGDGFTSLGSVSIFFDSDANTALTTVTANSSGVIPATAINIPIAARGVHNIIVRDNTTTAISISKLFTINMSKITITPNSGPVGTSVTISGNGFNSGGVIDFEFDGAAFTGVTSVTAVANGTFTKAAVIIPTTSAGAHTIIARVSSDTTVFASATFTINARILISPTTGTAGATVTITGSGFAPNGTLSFTYDAVPLATSPAPAVILANGTFSVQVVIPGAAAGAHTIAVTDGVGNTATANFISTITATVAPETSTATPGFVGQEVTVTGAGFVPNAAITVRLDNAAMASATANATGNFTATFKVPALAAGEHTVTMTDGTTTLPFVYIMEANAPQAPTLVSPASGTKPEQPITFDWNDVTDPSGVTYTFELAMDSNFSAVIVRKEGLTSSSFAMAEAEKLATVSKDAPYYWRVIAKDGAGNVGAPATPNAFTVGFSFSDIPMWAWVTMGFFAVVIIGGLAFYFYRRSARY